MPPLELQLLALIRLRSSSTDCPPDSDVFENMHANRFTTDDFADKTFFVALKIIHTVRQFNNYVVHVCSVVVSDAFVMT